MKPALIATIGLAAAVAAYLLLERVAPSPAASIFAALSAGVAAVILAVVFMGGARD